MTNDEMSRRYEERARSAVSAIEACCKQAVNILHGPPSKDAAKELCKVVKNLYVRGVRDGAESASDRIMNELT